MNQKELILAWVEEFKFIIPARMSGKVYKDHRFKTDTGKRCRELRGKGHLYSINKKGYEIYYKKDDNPTKKGIEN